MKPLSLCFKIASGLEGFVHSVEAECQVEDRGVCGGDPDDLSAALERTEEKLLTESRRRGVVRVFHYPAGGSDISADWRGQRSCKGASPLVADTVGKVS